MKNMFKNFVQEEQGQDLIEYTLLMAFIALASAAIFVNAGTSVELDLDQGQHSAFDRSQHRRLLGRACRLRPGRPSSSGAILASGARRAG